MPRQKNFTLLYLLPFLLFFALTSSAQKESLPKSYLQQTYLINAFIQPQLKKGALKITREEQLDSVFRLWEAGWRKVAADSMANNPTILSKEDFNDLDAYCYFW